MSRKTQRETATAIVSEAMRHVGYRAQPDRKSAFQLKPYLGKAWNGTFVDRVLHDALGDFAEVRFISTVTALAFYTRRNRLYQKPTEGAIVFFNFAADPQHAFEQPHVGVVTELLANGAFRTVEGETAPGTPQGSQLADGVFERVRYSTDVLGFVRPKARNRAPVTVTDPASVKMSYFESNPKTKARAVATVQLALNRVLGVSFAQGKFNGETKSALGLYNRLNGKPEARGEIDHAMLDTLAEETGTFVVD